MTSIPDDAAQTVPEPLTEESARVRQGVGTSLGLGVALAFCALIFFLRDYVIQVLPHILRQNDLSRFQEVNDGFPIPQAVNWNSSLIDIFIVLREPNPVLGTVVAVGLAVVGWIVAVALVNSTFRPVHTTPPVEGEAAATSPFTKASRIALRLLLPTAILWAITGAVLAGSLAFGLQAFVLMSALNIGFRRDGWAGDFDTPEFPRPPFPIARLVLRAAVFAVCAALLHAALLRDLQPTLNLYHTLGTFHRGYLREIGGAWLGMMGAFWFTLATLLFVLSRSRAEVSSRLALILLPIIGVLWVWLCRLQIDLAQVRARFDVTPEVVNAIILPYTPKETHSGIPTGIAGAKVLAKRVGLPFRDPEKARPTQNLFMFERTALFTRISTLTDDGQAADDATVQKIADYYKQKNGRSSMNWSAMRWMLSAASSQFDTSRVLELALQDLTTAPHVSKTGALVREILFTCAANARNHQSLDKLANERDFAFPDRQSQRMMGDLYRRFGDKEKALAWYRRAEMPQSFLKARREEKPMFRQGTVRGKLLVNGKPLVGARVAVFPRRLNGLPRDLEGSLFNSIREMAPRFGQKHDYVASSAAFRWFSTSAVTGADGSFEMKDLTEGEYAFVCTLSPISAPKRYRERFIQAKNEPTPFVLNYQTPTKDLGTMTFATGEESRK